jgi:kynurenine formamidase
MSTPLINQAGALRTYDLSLPFDDETPAARAAAPFKSALMRRHGDWVRLDGSTSAAEMITLSTHAGTHIDALCHRSFEGHMYGGVAVPPTLEHGRLPLGIDTFRAGLYRGVLLDVAGMKQVDMLEPGQPVTADDLEATCTKFGVSPGPGDAVLIRTGFIRIRATETFLGHSDGEPGPDESAARWMADRGVAVTGADTLGYEWLAKGPGYAMMPVHRILLVEKGIYIIENMDLEELAADGVHDFTLVLAPLKISGGTGSPLRPLAIVPSEGTK